MTEAERLRKRACWYRDFAKLSTSAERISRLALADFFERKAQEADDRRQTSTDIRVPLSGAGPR